MHSFLKCYQLIRVQTLLNHHWEYQLGLLVQAIVNTPHPQHSINLVAATWFASASEADPTPSPPHPIPNRSINLVCKCKRTLTDPTPSPPHPIPNVVSTWLMVKTLKFSGVVRGGREHKQTNKQTNNPYTHMHPAGWGVGPSAFT